MSSSSRWSREEDKSFETAIALHWNDEDEDEEEQWRLIASKVPSKSMDELKKHLNDLVDDVNAIEAGRIDLPKYETVASSPNDYRSFSGAGPSDKRPNCTFANGFSGLGHESTAQGPKGGSRAEQERRKGIPWTEEEHRLFLLGLDKFGKGDWRSISRNFVMSRSPTQVASHAQKYFIRLNSMNRDRRRSSIHDITSVNGSSGDVTLPQPPITGQQANANPTMAHPVGPLVKHRVQPNVPAMGMYRMPMGHPIGAPGHMASAVGTPVMLPPGHHPPYVMPMVYPPAMHQ